MKTVTFEIRECQNSRCRLRYPYLINSSFGNRCPRCMGETVPILEGEFREPEVPEARSARKPGRREALLDNIRSAANVGSIFRTAEGFGFEHIYLGGITPCPDDLDVKKTSLGSEESVA